MSSAAPTDFGVYEVIRRNQGGGALAAGFIGDAGLEANEVVDRLERAARLQATENPLKAAQLLSIAAGQANGERQADLALEAAIMCGAARAHGEIVHVLRPILEAQPHHRDVRWQLTNALGWLGQVEELRVLLAELPDSERSEARWVEVEFRALAQAARSLEALEIWCKHPELHGLPDCISLAAHTYANLNAFEMTEAIIARAFASTDDLPAVTRTNLTGLLAFVRSEQGRLEEAQDLHDRCIAIGQQTGHIGILAAEHYNRGFNQYRLGRYQEAVLDLERAIHFYNQMGNGYYSANARSVLGAFMARLGRFERAETSLLEAFEQLSMYGIRYALINSEWEIGNLYLEWRPLHGAALALKFARSSIGPTTPQPT